VFVFFFLFSHFFFPRLCEHTPQNDICLSSAVLFSVLDHYIRRNEGQQRVIGTLLGFMDEVNGCVVVTNCFAVKHSDKKDEVFLDMASTMHELHMRVNPKETIVGWYATSMEGVSIVDSSSLIHEFYASQCSDPVHLVIDTAMNGDHVGVKAFVSNPLSVNGIGLATVFQQVTAELETSEPERICLDRMMSGTDVAVNGGIKSDTAESLSELNPELKSLEVSMKRLLEMIEEASSYVDKVVSGELKADDETGRRIADTLASVPRIRPEVFDRVFNDNLQDLLMVSYLSSLTRSQLAIAERLSASM
jgi:translation initiation factor 3 subunit F